MRKSCCGSNCFVLNTKLGIKSRKMSVQGSNDDCYFYFYSSCTKGDDCPFRHCQAALGTETVCSLWREGRCVRDNCKFRHMESRINRKTIQCYWEDQPSGCLKPHCVFMHRKARPSIQTNSSNGGLILPVSNTPQTSPLAKVSDVKDAGKDIQSNPVESYSSNHDDNEICPTSIPIEPIVFSFDNEESDSESASSTPMKAASYDTKNNSVSVKKNLSDNFSERDDFGIKTLEQIKMEKIHKESDNFYKSAYDAPLIDPMQIKMDMFKPEIYPPKSDFISISERPVGKLVSERPAGKLMSERSAGKLLSDRSAGKPMNERPAGKPMSERLADNPVSATIDSIQPSPENERDIRNRLLKRKNPPSYHETSLPPPKKVVSLKKSKDDDSLDFKIKTLDEIRLEKKNKSGSEETSVEPTSQSIPTADNNMHETPPSLNKDESLNMNGKPFKRLKIKRQSNESVSNALQEADSSSDSQKKERTQMILHEVQNISEDQNKVDSLGKRKDVSSNCADVKNPKQLKINDSSSSKKINANESEERPIKSSRPIIKRKTSTGLFLQTSPLPPKGTVAAKQCEPTLPKRCDEVPLENNSSAKEESCNPSPLNNEVRTPKASVDEIDSFLMEETDMVTLNYEPDGGINETDDILLEIEQLLDS